MTNPEHDPRVEAVAKAMRDAEQRYWRGRPDLNYVEWEEAEAIEDALWPVKAAAAIAALDIPALERAAYGRGYSAAETDMTHGGLYASYGRETDE